MGEGSSIEEILELAITREVEAHQFYLDLVRRTKNPMMKKVFKELAGEELEHKAKIELEIMKGGKVVITAEKAADFNPSFYLENAEDTREMDYKDMLIMAIAKEKRSVRFYIELAALVKDKESRDVLISLAEEEAKHEARFQIEYDQLVRAKD
jgi:rubrerythrin